MIPPMTAGAQKRQRHSCRNDVRFSLLLVASFCSVTSVSGLGPGAKALLRQEPVAQKLSSVSAVPAEAPVPDADDLAVDKDKIPKPEKQVVPIPEKQGVVGQLKKNVFAVTSQTMFIVFLVLVLEIFIVHTLWNNLKAAKFAPNMKQKPLWEQDGSQLAFLACGITTIVIFVLFEHDWEKGSYYCPAWDCTPIRTRGLNYGYDGTNRAERYILAAVSFYAGYKTLTEIIHALYDRPLLMHPMFTLNSTLYSALRYQVCSFVIQYFTICILLMGRSFAFSTIHSGVVVLAFWGILVHLPTSLFLIIGTSTQARVAIPGFIFTSGAYIYLLWRLLQANSENFTGELLSYWLGMHVFLVCRYVNRKLTDWDLFGNSRFTISIFLGIVTLLPPSLGMLSTTWALLPMIVFNFITVYMNQSSLRQDNPVITSLKLTVPDGLLYAPSKADLENRYEIAIEQKTKEKTSAKLQNDAKREADTQKEIDELNEKRKAMKKTLGSDKEMAAIVFNEIDKNLDDSLDESDLTGLLVSWHVPSHIAVKYIRERLGRAEGCTLQEFQSGRELYSFAAHIVALNDCDAALSAIS